MSINRTLNTGASGIRSHGQALGAVGDNIANVNTVGFKKARAGFQDVLSNSPSGASSNVPNIGAGSRLAHVDQMWTQGALITTEAPTDLAVAGDGLFVVSGNFGGVDGQFFTRAGQFSFDANGNLVNPGGMTLQGYLVQDDGTMGTELADLAVAGGTIPATPSTAIDMAVQLDSEAAVPAAFDPLNASGTSNFSTSVSVYDSLGNGHEVTTYFRKSAANSWEWFALTDGANLTGGTAGVPTQGATGTLTFTTDGALDQETPGASTWDFLGATAGQAIAFDFGTSITGDGGTGLDASTQFAADSTINELSQDGFAAGTVAAVGIEGDGTITGAFSNGQRRTLGRVALATFASLDGLERAGSGLWTSTLESGEPLIGGAETGNRGSLVAGALEQSNVDLGQEFVDLIAYQRGFQANSRIISTADEVYTELVNLKR